MYYYTQCIKDDSNGILSTEMDSNEKKLITRDTDGYVITYNEQEKTAMDNYGQRWIAMDRNRQQWMYYHTQWIRDDNNGLLWKEMDSD